MKNSKRIGIFMDHSLAHIIEFDSNNSKPRIVVSDFTNDVKKESLTHGESTMHNKEQDSLRKYYNKLSDIIKDYNKIILFGPTNAKLELFNLLKLNHDFDNIEIETINTVNMSEKQQNSFVTDYFTKL